MLPTEVDQLKVKLRPRVSRKHPHEVLLHPCANITVRRTREESKSLKCQRMFSSSRIPTSGRAAAPTGPGGRLLLVCTTHIVWTRKNVGTRGISCCSAFLLTRGRSAQSCSHLLAFFSCFVSPHLSASLCMWVSTGKVSSPNACDITTDAVFRPIRHTKEKTTTPCIDIALLRVYSELELVAPRLTSGCVGDASRPSRAMSQRHYPQMASCRARTHWS